ncbi:hypothetical protein [Mucilaginibacter paludis]|uniref:Uncharacterized protein n=1 Tax=Mucilaginibacter paludis DSM 18603 TaxID=714943 RepID=H1Y3R3_9SPHI|nr:hypothetical protein [Mucilaginibacter paludis]EHQ30325.1 hypothetical protein Mucpa_6269 [Mucilaginibacter paludis DSM 18603]
MGNKNTYYKRWQYAATPILGALPDTHDTENLTLVQKKKHT